MGQKTKESKKPSVNERASEKTTATTADENLQPKEAIPQKNEVVQNAATSPDTASDSLIESSEESKNTNERNSNGEKRSTPVDDLSESWEKVVGKTSVPTEETNGVSNIKQGQTVSAALGAASFDTEDEENINLQTDAAAVARMKSAATKKKKGRKMTTAAEVAKKEMQSAPVVKKKKKKIR